MGVEGTGVCVGPRSGGEGKEEEEGENRRLKCA